VIDRIAPTGAVLLALTPVTGRTHQLRVHAARAGSPLLGDPRYGGARRVTRGDGVVVAAARTMLHCAEVTLDLDGGGAPLRLRSPAPPDLARVWADLGGNAGQLDGSAEGAGAAAGDDGGDEDDAGDGVSGAADGRRSSRAR